MFAIILVASVLCRARISEPFYRSFMDVDGSEILALHPMVASS